MLAGKGAGEPVHSVCNMIAGMAELAEPAHHILGNLPVILDQQQFEWVGGSEQRS